MITQSTCFAVYAAEFILHLWETIHDVEIAVEVFSKFKKGKLNCRT